MEKSHPARDAWLIMMLLLTEVAAYGQHLPMTVEIGVAQSSVKNNEEFPVSTTVRNVGRDAQSLQIWSCSYPEQWTRDNPAVHIPGAACKKNDVIRVRLKPGEAYEETLSIGIGVTAEHRSQKSITFRLGFVPANPEKTGAASPIWSNAITVKVTE
jgi:hypothetical protein